MLTTHLRVEPKAFILPPHLDSVSLCACLYGHSFADPRLTWVVLEDICVAQTLPVQVSVMRHLPPSHGHIRTSCDDLHVNSIDLRLAVADSVSWMRLEWSSPIAPPLQDCDSEDPALTDSVNFLFAPFSSELLQIISSHPKKEWLPNSSNLDMSLMLSTLFVRLILWLSSSSVLSTLIDTK